MPPKTKVDLKKLEADRLQALLQEMMKEEENKYCADCEAKQPRWASWNLGIFLCIRCAGLHRNLGVHISKVKSVNLDSWTPEQVQSMRVMGNAKAKAVYESELPDMFRRPQTDQALEQFIRAKYEQKRYILREWAPPKVDIRDLPPLDLQDKKHPKVSPTPSQGSTASLSLSKPPTIGQPGQVKIPTNTSAPAIIDEQLLDFGEPTPQPHAQQQTQPSGGLFDLMSSPTGSSGSGTGTPTQTKSDDLDDIFGSMVSAPPMNSSVSAPKIEQQPTQIAQTTDGLGDLSGLSLGSSALNDEKKTANDILSLFGNTQSTAFAPPVVNSMQQQGMPNMGMNNFSMAGGMRPMGSQPNQGFSTQQAPPQMFNQMMPNLAQPGMVPMSGSMMPSQPIRPAGNSMDFFGGLSSGMPSTQSAQPAKAQPSQPPAFNPNSFSLFSGDKSLTFNAFSGSSNTSTLNPTPSNMSTSNNLDLDFGNLNMGSSTASQPVPSSNSNNLDLLFS